MQANSYADCFRYLSNTLDHLSNLDLGVDICVYVYMCV